jgi:hypothetical protein
MPFNWPSFGLLSTPVEEKTEAERAHEKLLLDSHNDLMAAITELRDAYERYHEARRKPQQG